MLTVQMIISSVEADVRNGSSQRRYHGNTAGAHKREAAIGQENMGQANMSGDDSGAPLLLIQVAVANPTSTASPTSNCGGATRASIANTGPLKRKLCTYVPSEPIGMWPWLRNGRYSSPTTTAASAASRMRTRFQDRGKSTTGRNFTAIASPSATAAVARHRRTSAAADT